MKRNVTLRILLLYAAVVPILLPSCGNNGKSNQDNRAGGGQLLKVKMVVVAPQTLEETIHTTGTIMANEEISLSAEVSGRITKISFQEGEKVARGQLLVKLDDRELRAELQKAGYEKELSGDREARQKHLLSIGAISREEYDAALNALNVLKSQIALLEARLDKTELRAPFDGVMGLRNTSEGAAISPSTIIATLQNINPMKLEFSVPEKYSNSIHTGMKVQFRLQAFDSLFTAEVYAIEPRIEAQSRTLRVRARFPNAGNRAIPGAFADISLAPKGSRNSFMIPSRALIPDAQGAFVFILTDGKADVRRVETAFRSRTHVEIVSGLQAGDTVLTSALQQLRKGMEVETEADEFSQPQL